jgi:hypothetical protein
MSTKEIQAERDAQRAKWGDAADDQWTLGEWSALLAHYATRRAVGDLRAVEAAAFRADMVKVGALALACIEAIDRKVP